MATLKVQLATAQAEIDQLKGVLADREEQIMFAEEHVEAANKEMADKDRRIEILEEKLEKAQALYVEQDEQMSARIASLQAQLEAAQKRLNEQAARLEVARETFIDQRSEIVRLREAAESKKNRTWKSGPRPSHPRWVAPSLPQAEQERQKKVVEEMARMKAAAMAGQG